MKRLRRDPEAQLVLANTVELSTVSAGDFDAVFYPGGHGPLWDLAEDRDWIALIERFYAAGKPVARSAMVRRCFATPRRPTVRRW